jgi:quinoprotein glucose dehydrogenase
MMSPLFRTFTVVPLLALQAWTLLPAAELGDGKKKPKGTILEEGPWLKSLELPPGLEPSVWAKGDQILNSIAIDVDEQGRVFAAETARWRMGGVIDVRGNLFLYKDDLRVETTADRAAMIEKWKDKFPKDFFTKETERVRLIVDSDGDGKADKASVFTDGFRDAVDGPAAGIMAYNGRVYLTNIPKLYVFDDKNNDGVADQHEVLADGFGPRFSISGHDMHGLAMGPDGRVYFSMGDRGYHVTSKEGKTFKNPLSGGVFRCDPDGSNFEQYYWDLRNPQELAFDAWGNLFTVDNNADIGDAARVVYILEGGTSAWNHGWQLLGNDSFCKTVGLAGRQPIPWLDDGLWKSTFKAQPAWLLPAVGHITSGPSGLAFYPGLGFGDRLTDHFLVCDYRASRESGVWSYKLNEVGAGFSLPEEQKKHFLWGLPPTDVTFGYDGRVYISDYIGGWELNTYGRIVTVSDPATSNSQEIKLLSALMKEGFTKRPVSELASLLAHADMRVRQHAQFELVARGNEGQQALTTAALQGATTFERVHGVWGIGQIARKVSAAAQPLVALLADGDVRVREQAAKTLGDIKYTPAGSELTKLLIDSHPRVQSFAAIALGRLEYKSALPAVIKVLALNADKDVYLRHALVMALLGTADAKQLTALSVDRSPAVRMGALLALRRLSDNGCAAFLNDADQLVRAEAIRAVYDKNILEVMPQLLAQLDKPIGVDIPVTIARLLYLRLINATQRQGDDSAVKALSAFAANQTYPVDVRLVALKALESWQTPTWIDPVIGLPRKAKRREKDPDPALLKADLMSIIDRREEQLLASAVKLAQRYGYGLADDVLVTILDNVNMASEVRREVLSILTERKYAGLKERLPHLLRENKADIRRAAFTTLVKIDPAESLQAGIVALGLDSKGEPDILSVENRTEGAWASLPMGVPTAANIANKGVITWIENFSDPHADAGANGFVVGRLNDGQLAENEDDAKRSVWFEQHEARFVLDLGSNIDIDRVDTYSWHKSNRAPQNFTLWGASGNVRPDATAPSPGDSWVKLAGVNTSDLGEGGKHGSSVLNAYGSLGTYRWIMWQSTFKGTYFNEVAVYPHGQAPDGLVRVVLDQEQGNWDKLVFGGPDVAGLALSGITATSVEGFAKPAAGAGAVGDKLPRLFASELPANSDDSAHNVWADEGEARWLIDLQKPVELARINTYSWHKSDRAAQAFTLWAADGDKAPDATSKNLSVAGWRQLAVVNSKAKGKNDKNEKQGSSIMGVTGAIETYRWLLWQHHETKKGTYISRIDIFPTGVELPPLKRPLSMANVALKQQVFTEFGAMNDAGSAAVISDWLDKLNAGTALGHVHLELLAAAEARKEPAFTAKVKAFREGLDASDPLSRYRVSQFGGDEKKGEEIFKFHIAQCIKCHSVKQEGGNAGPDLAGVGKRLDAEKILESLIEPSKVVVPGFGLATITLKDGASISGSLLKQDKKEGVKEGVLVRTADNKEQQIADDLIDSISPALSPMPPMGLVLSAIELRDVMAYLQSLK